MLTPSANLMTDTGLVVDASLFSSGTKHVPVVLLSPTDQSIFLRKGGTVGVLQSVPRIEIFNVSDGTCLVKGMLNQDRCFPNLHLNCYHKRKHNYLLNYQQNSMVR